MPVLWTICGVKLSPSALIPGTPTLITPALTWDIFCRVIDNHGDLGVCWRLSADLAQRGQSVRLWVDDASALAWMAPQNYTGVEVRTWPNDAALQAFAQDPAFEVGNVVLEAFGCELPEAFQALMVRGTVPVWINLEYLSAEAYVARSHGLASPVMSGPARGATKWFYFPGFTLDTGGLLREPDLRNRQAAFDRAAWLKALPLDKPIAAHEQLISLFCYEPAALPEVLQGLSQADQPTRLLVTQGRPNAAVVAATQALNMPIHGTGRLHISQLPYFSQNEFDHLLWACDLNFVRGEDSLVRALWAGKPFVWHIYPQDDLAHHDKLQAFYQALQIPQTLQQVHNVWNGRSEAERPAWTPSDLAVWQTWSTRTQQLLQTQTDLSTQLIGFVAQKR
ncbi:Elongation-Factor P (EF-P) rhamnosyltransferase EarP [Burkholderiaceae bacterium]